MNVGSVSGLRLSPLYSSTRQGGTVTAECNNRCRSSSDCAAYLVDYVENTCWRLDTNTADGLQLQPQEEASKTNYFEKICLNAPACEKAWVYERVGGFLLEGHDDRVVQGVQSRRACQVLPCLLRQIDRYLSARSCACWRQSSSA